MATPTLSDDILREAWEVAREAGSIAGGARCMNPPMPRTTFESRVRAAIERLNLPPIGTETKYWTADPVPTQARSIDKLLEHKRDEALLSKDFEDGTKLINIKIKTPGPVGFMVFGDPHIDSWGCDFNMLEAHLKIARSRPGFILSGNIGDIRDNWVGRLSHLVWKNTLTAKETWKLAEWLFTYIQWTWLIRGNHDMWSGDNDPLDWVSKESGVGVDRDSGVRIAFQHPNGVETRLHARHDFPGRSYYNANHGMKREAMTGYRDHIYVAGHLHYGMDSAEIIGDSLIQMVRVSGYKKSDQYRHTKGFHPSNIHPSALIIVDPDQPDDSRSRCFCTPTVEEGAEYLDWKRNRFEGLKVVVPVSSPKPKRKMKK